MTALVTEHFVLQGARATLTSEAASRASLYLASVTSSLIALGFVANNGSALLQFAAAIIRALLILGEFTFSRLVMGGIEDLHYRFEMQAIRAYYRHLVPEGLNFFSTAEAWKSPKPVKHFMGVAPRDLNVLLTAASMVAAINSIVAGAAAAMAAYTWASVPSGPAIGLAVVVALVLFLVHSRLAIRQYNIGLADLRE